MSNYFHLLSLCCRRCTLESQVSDLSGGRFPLLASLFLDAGDPFQDFRRDAPILLQQGQKDATCTLFALIGCRSGGVTKLLLLQGVVVLKHGGRGCHMATELLLSPFILHLFELEASLAEVHPATILDVYGFADELEEEANVDGAH